MKNALTRPPGGKGILLAIDPGKNSTGIALFGGGELLDVELAKDPYHVANLAMNPVDEVIVELPRAYGPRSPVDPNDLILLGALAGFLVGITPCNRRWYIHPQDWKGQMPKEIDNQRTIRHLKDNERQLLGARPNHNVVDAVGIGLWVLGRRK